MRRTRPTWPTSDATMRRSSPERVRCVRSSSDSTVASTTPASRFPHASVTEKIGVSARPTASCSTTATVIVSPPAQVASLSISLERSSKSSPTTSTSARQASRSALAPSRANCSPTHSGTRRFCTSYVSSSPAFLTALASAESAFSSAATSASTVAGAGDARYSATAFTSSAFQRSTSSTMTRRPLPTKRPMALHAATASAPPVSRALSCSVASSPTRSRRRRSARVILGRSLPESKYTAFSSVVAMAPTIRGYQEHDGGERGNARRRGHLRSRKAAEPACAPGHEPCTDTVDLRERGRDGRRDRRDHGGRERDDEHLGHDRDGHDVGWDGDDGNLAELQPRHRCGGEAARGRHADELREPPRNGIALEEAHDAWRADEDRGDGCEGQLKARVEDERRVPREQRERSDEQRMPPVTLAREEPGERAERRRDGGAHDGRVEADRERVRADCGERRHLGCDTTETEQPHERERACGNGPHLEAVDGEAVIEAGCAKAREQRVVETLSMPEHDRLDDGAPRPAQPERGVTGEPALQPVSDAAYARPAADDAPLLHPQDDMNPLSA